MGAAARASHRAIATEIWHRIFGFFLSTRTQRDRVLQRLSLTPNDARALNSLDGAEGRTMRQLADEWGCDASNATWIIDRLEKRGLAGRHAMPGDRRVKMVRLTPEGTKLKRNLFQGIMAVPPELLTLDREALEALQDAVERLPPASRPSDQPLRTSGASRRLHRRNSSS